MERAIPLGTNVLVNPIDDERKTESGIILLTNSTDKSPFRKGAVEEKGGGNKWNDMTDVRKGDVVLYGHGAGVPVHRENDRGEDVTFLLIDYENLIAVE